MLRLSKNVETYVFGQGALSTLGESVKKRRDTPTSWVVYLIDEYFSAGQLKKSLPIAEGDLTQFITTDDEPTTDAIDALTAKIRAHQNTMPAAIIGIGGGITLDTAKAVSNLLGNGGKAEDYQGWDLVKTRGIYKIGVPTLSGTGAEASRTCVLTNKKKNLKLGMNSEFSVFDHLILDPTLSATVDRDQYFFSGMDTYVHCVESLRGNYRHILADSYSHEALRLCEEVFSSDDMMATENREKIMVASYLGGASIANTFVGVVHPLSAGLSTVYGLHHCVSNCIVMNVMEDFYPAEQKVFQQFVARQKIKIPQGICQNASDEDFRKLYESAVVHEKPLINALGKNYRDILTFERVKSVYQRM